MDSYKKRKKNTTAIITFDKEGNIFLKKKGSSTKVWVGDKNTEIDERSFWDQYNYWVNGGEGQVTNSLF